MKGIILAGGKGTRLYPVTQATCKQLLPVFDKPLIYYPMATLMQAGITEILIISTPHDTSRFEALFGDGSHLGLAISYAVQKEPRGIAEAFLIAEPFIENQPVALILGDNIFYGHDMASFIRPCTQLSQGAIVFGYEVKDPERYGVLDLDENQEVRAIIEKPRIAPSPYAVTGLYFYDSRVVEIARSLTPSLRGEIEITDVNNAYLENGELEVRLLSRGFAWLDTGTHDALQKASIYVQTIQERQGIQVACLEEIAYQNGWISLPELAILAKRASSSDYGLYLQSICKRAALQQEISSRLLS
ncbi:MAG: glucose-1-phosphate thymidylyltransferase RfbA [Rhabdochlamydiaceae bacterium]|nr:glucose-1-phosphate thymidylyltransferase RfbA [Rhabdochlamydiaceae bacterium]